MSKRQHEGPYCTPPGRGSAILGALLTAAPSVAQVPQQPLAAARSHPTGSRGGGGTTAAGTAENVWHRRLAALAGQRQLRRTACARGCVWGRASAAGAGQAQLPRQICPPACMLHAQPRMHACPSRRMHVHAHACVVMGTHACPCARMHVHARACAPMRTPMRAHACPCARMRAHAGPVPHLSNPVQSASRDPAAGAGGSLIDHVHSTLPPAGTS